MTDRDAKIIKDAEEQGIPIFVFTAKDKLSPYVLDNYAVDAEKEGCSDTFVNNVIDRLEEFDNWQAEHPNFVKLPD
jgi:hypothetical protein